MARQHAFMQLPGGPVAEQAAGVEQTGEQADEAVIVQFDAGHAAVASSHQRRRLARAPLSMVESSSSACCLRLGAALKDHIAGEFDLRHRPLICELV